MQSQELLLEIDYMNKGSSFCLFLGRTTSVKSTNLVSRYLDLLDEENVEFNLEDCILQRGENKEVLGSLAKEVVTEPIETKIVPDAGPIDEPHDIPDNSSPESFSVQKTREVRTE